MHPIPFPTGPNAGHRRAMAMWWRWMLMLNLAAVGVRAEDAGTRRELDLLREQNQQLQAQLQRQQEMIDRLGRTVADLQETTARSGGRDDGEGAETSGKARSLPGFGKVQLSGEGGFAFFKHQAGGEFAKGTLRVDEAKLFVEAAVAEDLYFFSELNFYRREDPSDVMNVGEIYLDFENLSKWWNKEGQLSLRLGRLDIPFGQEYLVRDAIDNPLISHSLMDFWGVDEGVELYGALGKVRYVVAAQNGGHPSLYDYNADKSVALRLSYDPLPWMQLSASAMRTGDLDVKGDKLSELWFADGFVRSLGSTNTTSFRADVVQGDARFVWRGGYAALSGGYLRYGDNDPGADNGRDVYFYAIEAVQHVTKRLYAGARFSHILAPEGFPLVGDGTFGEYFSRKLTENLWRLSLGVGYQLSPHVLLKAEYSINQGTELGGASRSDQNLIASEVAFKF